MSPHHIPDDRLEPILRNSRDVQSLIGMHGPAADSIVAFYSATFLMLAVVSREGVDVFWPVVLAVVIVSLGAVALVRIPGDPIPIRPTWALTAVGPVSCALVLGVLPIPQANPMQTWPLAASTAIYAFMGVRGRPGYAWLGMLSMIVTCVVWTTLTGQGAALGLGMTAINLAPLLMATFFAFTLRPSARQIYTLRDQTTRRVAAEAADSAILEERDRQLRRLDEQARPLLARIAAGEPLDADTRLACRLLEAHLRDSVRAPSMADPVVVAAARTARARGVEVILLDDRAMDTAPTDAQRRFLDSVAAELTSARDGRVTVRILPPGRAAMATILSSYTDSIRRSEFGHDGRPVESAGGDSG
ncbi:hypothetical protein ACFYVR_09000 [Rhodococcus sp. NPDC003318]|uniref:hypothetical protein n=1 Tax=Rhodococcus sp. NPDC003318 TaxID=3364503 RepID=UPI0036C01C21